MTVRVRISVCVLKKEKENIMYIRCKDAFNVLYGVFYKYKVEKFVSLNFTLA